MREPKHVKRNQNEIHYRNRHQTKYSLIANDKMTEKQNARQNLKHMRLTCTNTNPSDRQIIHHRPPSPPLPPPHLVGTHKWSNPWGLPEGSKPALSCIELDYPLAHLVSTNQTILKFYLKNNNYDDENKYDLIK